MTTPSDPTLGWSIGVLFRSWQDGASRALEGLPHGARGFQILATVAHDEPPTQASLAAHLGIDRTVLTYVLDDLVEHGVLERTVDPADRRVRRLAATASGRELLAELEQRVGQAERALFSRLTESEQEQLRSALYRAASQIHGAEPGHDACRAVAQVLTTGP